MNAPELLHYLHLFRLKLQEGKSISRGLEELAGELPTVFARALDAWRVKREAGLSSATILTSLPVLTATQARAAFLGVLERGLQGAPIDGFLEDLEGEFFFIAEQTYERDLQVLPLRLLLPLTLFILPGVLLLILAPLLIGMGQDL